MKHDFDIVVVGGGHAGVEAALVASRMGADTCLVTHRFDRVGEMSCNPAIGGLGKGHLVREIDAFDGVMGRAADFAGIQFRLLNRKKGPAVQGPRAQTDRSRYRRFIQNEVKNSRFLTTIEGEVTDLMVNGCRCSGVTLGDGSVLSCSQVILTTGTFLNGKILIGNETSSGGRIGDSSSIRLAERIRDLDLSFGRLKTGTPPRLNGKTINWDEVETQPGDEDPVFFSFLTNGVQATQISCGITHTNERTHDIIRENLSRSAMYGGHVEGVGPRYCPSIEDKVVRFSEKQSHQIFLEPEGVTDNTIYPNGISTSLPIDVQTSYVRSIKGLSDVEIVQPGYAIEYDYVDPRGLDIGLNVKDLPGLLLAGQINGTTGYEEAAAQGLAAGINAVRNSRDEEPYYFSRMDSYIGVMIDDLISKGVSEPYRMFTSRAEFRLMLRVDNADRRLTGNAIDIGCVSSFRKNEFDTMLESIDACNDMLKGRAVSPQKARNFGLKVNLDGVPRSAYDLLAYKDIDFDTLSKLWPDLTEFDSGIRKRIECDAKYAHYLERQRKDIEALKRDESVSIPDNFRYDGISGLSNELTTKLTMIQPKTIGHAGRIEGMTPAALALILVKINQPRAKSA